MNSALFNTVDLIAVPPVLILLTAAVWVLRRREPPNLRKYFFPAFLLRVLGTVALGVIVQFVYGYGDTYFYFYGAQALGTYLPDNPGTWLHLLFTAPDADEVRAQALLEVIKNFNTYTYYVYQGTENANISKIAAVFNLICFNSWLAIAICFSFLAFLGCWYIFKTFVHIFPGYEKQFSWMCLFLPSLWFWGSGILKDPVCLFGLGILFYSFFVKKHSLIFRLMMMLFGTFILLSIKSYIFYSFAAAAAAGFVIYRFRRFNVLVKLCVFVAMAGTLVLAFPMISAYIAGTMENLIGQSEFFLSSYTRSVNEGDATILPDFDSTPMGFLKLALQGLGTVYFRPFPWEYKKLLYLFLILENLAVYYIVFKRVKTGPVVFRANSSYLVNFSFVFFLFLGIIIGVTTFNLGTIARYRVPALPFVFAGIFCWKLLRRRKAAGKLPNSENVVSEKI